MTALSQKDWIILEYGIQNFYCVKYFKYFIVLNIVLNILDDQDGIKPRHI